MCGIAGIIQPGTNRYSKEHLGKMTGALSHRGPDGEQLWQNENGQALLGHRRLSIIDLSDMGQQPMHYLDRYTIIHNGEIYNYVEIREELVKKGYTFRSRTDTEVIAASYDHWKENCVLQFDGMFAFAIWDEKEKELFAARDRFGEKPFYYIIKDNSFLFASEMKALRAAGIPGVLNQKMLFNFITIGYTDNPSDPSETFYRDIQKLPAASHLFYSPGDDEVAIDTYWELDPTKQEKTISDTDALEKFNELFQTSVLRRLRSDVAIGGSLSGGIDSSAVMAIAASMRSQLPTNPDGMHAFTAVFPGFEKDEAPFSKLVAQQFDLRHDTVSLSGDDMLDDLQRISHYQEEPFGSASVFPQFKVYEMAKQNNVKVLLDGQGADETLAGYSKYYKWYWQELFRRRKLYRSRELKAAREIGINERFGLRNMIAAYFPDFSTIVLERQYLLKAIRHEDLSREFVKEQSNEAYYTAPGQFTLNGVLHFNTCIHGLEELLRYADRNAMAHGREVRLPFLSHELVEFIFSLPAQFKIRRGRTKWILRESMKKRLPEEIVWRKDKVGFEPPQQLWMENPRVQEAIRSSKEWLVKENILRKEVLNKKIVPKPAHAPDNFDWRYLSAAFCFK